MTSALCIGFIEVVTIDAQLSMRLCNKVVNNRFQSYYLLNKVMFYL